eukprot:m51a1_g9921 putative adenylate cyclase (343) ;mRNA; f:153325-159372
MLLADQFAEATVLFTDIAGFTNMSSKLSAEKIVTVINGVFSLWDNLLEQHSRDHAELMMRFAVATLGSLREYNGGTDTPKIAYDLWGDTVSVAPRMEHNEVVGCVQVTEETYQRLCKEFDVPRLPGSTTIASRAPCSSSSMRSNKLVVAVVTSTASNLPVDDVVPLLQQEGALLPSALRAQVYCPVVALLCSIMARGGQLGRTAVLDAGLLQVLLNVAVQHMVELSGCVASVLCKAIEAISAVSPPPPGEQQQQQKQYTDEKALALEVLACILSHFLTNREVAKAALVALQPATNCVFSLATQRELMIKALCREADALRAEASQLRTELAKYVDGQRRLEEL